MPLCFRHDNIKACMYQTRKGCQSKEWVYLCYMCAVAYDDQPKAQWIPKLRIFEGYLNYSVQTLSFFLLW